MGEKLGKYPREDQNNLYYATDISSLSLWATTCWAE